MLTMFHLLLVISFSVYVNAVNGVLVNVEDGVLRGEVLQVVTGDAEYISFKGIPYAAPPVGPLRFKPPQKPQKWNGVRNATQHGSICFQKNYYTNELIPSSEDCLYLNVYSPNIKPQNPLPVIFYIHGGGFQLGSGNVDQLGPDHLMKQNVVVVTFNYRLDIFGFLCMNTVDVPGNAGLYDQAMALKWVNKNIAKFGGDPDNVTLVGQSAGAASVALHTLSPLSKGLFKRAASMSGVPFNDWALWFEARRRAFIVGQELGLWTRNDTELLNHLQSVPSESLLKVNASVLLSENPNIFIKQLIFTPVVEIDNGANHFLTVDPVKAFEEGKSNFEDYMIGHVNSEGYANFATLGDVLIPLYNRFRELLVPQKILNVVVPRSRLTLADTIYQHYFGQRPINITLAKEIVNYISDSSFNYDVIALARLLPRVGKRVYMYQFSTVTSLNVYGTENEYGIVGATHEDDLAYLFYPVARNLTINTNSVENQLIQRTCGLFANFARSGNPTPDNSLGIQWPEYNNATRFYLNIGNTLSTGQNLDADVLAFWESVFNDATSFRANFLITYI